VIEQAIREDIALRKSSIANQRRAVERGMSRSMLK
jgi:hypothetical protein